MAVLKKHGVMVDAGREKQGRIAKMWFNCQGGLYVFAVYFWHTEGETPRNQASMEAVLISVVSTDVMAFAELRQGEWVKLADAYVVPTQRRDLHVWSNDSSRSASWKDVELCGDQHVFYRQGRQVQVTEDCGSNPHEPISDDLHENSVRCASDGKSSRSLWSCQDTVEGRCPHKEESCIAMEDSRWSTRPQNNVKS